MGDVISRAGVSVGVTAHAVLRGEVTRGRRPSRSGFRLDMQVNM